VALQPVRCDVAHPEKIATTTLTKRIITSAFFILQHFKKALSSEQGYGLKTFTIKSIAKVKRITV